MQIEKYSIGLGDRFGRQGHAQLAALVKAKADGIDVAPVWNKSHREHRITNTQPQSVRVEADAAVKTAGWAGQYLVDADHIALDTVDTFIEPSDFFTLDVAEYIGKPAEASDADAFVKNCRAHVGTLSVPGIDSELTVTNADIDRIASTYLRAVHEAGRIYRHIENSKGKDNFIVEVSMDETHAPQTPTELFFILAAIAEQGMPIQTIAPKFSGRFNKGVDYVGDVAQFEEEFNADLCVIAHAIETFGLPENLKLSVHSGSDKFSIYAPIHTAIQRHDAGLHLKTAGTTWLEELIGLASAGEEGLDIAREIYRMAFNRFGELCGPYSTVIDIDTIRLPPPADVDNWTGEQYAATIRHDPSNDQFNPHMRQLLHVGFKIAAEMGPRYTDALDRYADTVSENVTTNILDRHLRPLFAPGS